MESKKVVQHVYLVGAKSIYRVAEKDKEYLRDEEEKNQNYHEKLGTSDIPYFYLMKSGDTIPNLPMNAIPVFYGDDYEDVKRQKSQRSALLIYIIVGDIEK